MVIGYVPFAFCDSIMSHDIINGLLLGNGSFTSDEPWDLTHTVSNSKTSTKKATSTLRLCQGRNVNRQWFQIKIQISRLIVIWIWISAALLSKCGEFTALSASVILPSFVEIGGKCMRNGQKCPKIPYSAMVRKMKKWSRYRSGSTTKFNHFQRVTLPYAYHVWSTLVTAIVNYSAQRTTDKMTEQTKA